MTILSAVELLDTKLMRVIPEYSWVRKEVLLTIGSKSDVKKVEISYILVRPNVRRNATLIIEDNGNWDLMIGE